MVNKLAVKEERLYERLRLPIKVEYELSTRPRDINRATVKNISGGGICIPLAEKLFPDSRLQINIKIPDEKFKECSIKARVAWARRVETFNDGELSGYYETGIQFMELDPITIGKIVSCFEGRKL